jgi:hypothetical protein
MLRAISRDPVRAMGQGLQASDMNAARKRFVGWCAEVAKHDFQLNKTCPTSAFPSILRNKINILQVRGNQERD